MEEELLGILLTQNSFPIIGWFASLLGRVMEGLYALFCYMGVENIGLCIIIFTLFVKLILFPLTIKQQKFSKLSVLMNPEIQEVQKKYKGKRDNESMMKMQEETQKIYDKYGTSPTGSCLQLVIQMPIIFSLYYIVSNIPAYVPQVQDYYKPISTEICEDYDYFECFNKVVKSDDKLKYTYIDKVVTDFKIADSDNKKVIDVLAKYSTKQWASLENTYENMNSLIDKLSTYSDKDWDKLESKLDLSRSEEKTFDKFVEEISNKDSSEKLKKRYSDCVKSIDKSKKKIMDINKFGVINLSQTPKSTMGWAILIPILSFLTQWYSTKLAMATNQMPDGQNPMASSMKMMNTVMPLFSAFIAFTVPAGLGLYWVANGGLQIIQQLALNQYFKKVDVNDIIKKNVEKKNKKKAKQGNASSRVINAANINAKGISNNKMEKKKDIPVNNSNIKPGSLAEKANMVKKYNEKNK